MTKTIVAWDLGATKCAAAIVEYDDSQRLNCKKHGSIKIRSCHSLEELTASLENMLGIKMADADAICIGAAGQYNGEFLELDAGYPYPMNFAHIAKEQNWPPFAIIHDYSPIVCATFTPYIEQPDNIRRLNEASLNPEGRRVALGVGTGVGMKDGVLFPDGNFWLGTNEIGHIGVITPPLADKIYLERHCELIKFLRCGGVLADNEPLTFEKLLAGQGIVRIHSFFDREASKKTSEEIGAHVRDGHADETLALFAWYLGLLVGTIQLAFLPDGGIWLTGGVILSHLDVFDHSDFYVGIESSPAYLNLRQQFPLGLLCGAEHAFMGSAYYVTKRLL